MIKVIQERKFVSSAALVAVIVGLGIGQAALQNKAEAQRTNVQAPTFEVDPFWPKPFNGLLGMAIGVWVDEQDYVWIIHRSSATLHNNEKGAELNPPIAECCRGAPPVLAFDPEGNLVKSWGGPGPGYEWPQSNHGIHIDYKGNVWIGGNGEKDAHILKFTKDGKFLMQVGGLGKNAGSNNLENFGRVAKICVDRSNDGLIYVCDRANDRVQVFRPDGTFVKEAFFAKNTLGSGSAWDIAFSRDPEQRFIFMADGQNNRVRIIVRETLEEVTAFGDGGRQPGQFYGVHSIATDSKGNIYTTETWEGKRLQKFVYKGIGNVVAANQGVLWPRR